MSSVALERFTNTAENYCRQIKNRLKRCYFLNREVYLWVSQTQHVLSFLLLFNFSNNLGLTLQLIRFTPRPVAPMEVKAMYRDAKIHQKARSSALPLHFYFQMDLRMISSCSRGHSCVLRLRKILLYHLLAAA